MRFLPYFTGLAIFLILSSMLLTIPYQMKLLQGLDRELQRAEECESGSERSCKALEAPASLHLKVKEGTSSWEGMCLFISEEGVAVKTSRGHISDVLL
jgi:hypothetical protein